MDHFFGAKGGALPRRPSGTVRCSALSLHEITREGAHLFSVHTISTMELRSSSKCSAEAKACLVAGHYAAASIKEVVDEAAAEVVLQLGGAPGDGDVKGASAVLK